MVKVLLVNWAWRNVGGDWTYIDNIKKLYEANGYEVIPFSTINVENVKTNYDKYFVDSFNFKELNKNKGVLNTLTAGKNSVISSDATSKIKKLIQDHKITFAHFHNIHHHITPAIIWKLKNAGIPIIWTLHDYKLICPDSNFVSNGEICEKCFDKKFYNCTLNKCKKKSYPASVLATLDAYFYNFSGIYNKVDLFLCPSQFLLDKFKQFNFQVSKLKLTNLCYDIDRLDQQIKELEQDKQLIAKDARYIFYVGRVEKIKGIFTLIEAVAGTGITLKIAGSGDAIDEAVNYVKDNNLGNIEFLGFQDKKNIYKLTYNAQFVICPSEWYENYPFSVIESMLISKAVVGAKIGGIPELVIDNKTGFLFESGNHVDLKNKISTLWNDPGLCTQFGMEGRNFAYNKVNFDTHWKILKELIETLPVSDL